MADLTDEQRERELREWQASPAVRRQRELAGGWESDHVFLLRLLDAARERAEAAQAKVADAWAEGWGAAGEAYVEGVLAAARGEDCPQSDGPPNPYLADQRDDRS